MRIVLPNMNRAKATSKWLKALSEKQVPGVRRLTLSKAQEATASMLGYSGWHELEQITGALPASTHDHEIPLAHLRERRAYQAERLAAFGYTQAAAVAFVDILLPSGRFDEEMAQARVLYDQLFKGDALVGKPEDAVEGAWYRERYGFDEDFARRVARTRRQIGEPLFEAIARANRAESWKGSTTATGYMAVVIEKDLFWQGYFLPTLPADLAATAESMGAELRKHIEQDTAGPEGMMRFFAALANGMGGAGGVPYQYTGALSAGAVDHARRGDVTGVAVYGHLLRKETGHDFFVVHLRGESAGGLSTSIDPLPATTVDEAKAAIDALPEVQAIKANLSKKYGLL